MRSIQDALFRLADQASCFARVRRQRVLHVRAAADLRVAALEVVLAMEHHGLNRAPWLLVPDATLGADRGWPARSERLRADHAKRRVALAEAGFSVGELALPEDGGAPLASLHGPVGAFGAMVRAYRHSLPDPFDGLVVVLAPTRVELTPEWSEDLSALAMSPELGDVRWVLVDEGEGEPLARTELAGLVRACRCAPDPAQARADTTAILASAEAGRGLGVAAPGDHPPVRPAEARARREPAPRSAEVSVTEAILTAAARVQQGELARAIEWQIAACRRAEAVQRTDLAARCRLVLAGYLQAAGKGRSAAGQYARAAAIAEEGRRAGEPGLEAVEVSARFALGLSLWSRRRDEDALPELGRTADLAEDCGQIAVAIAAWRHAGQLARELGLLPQCVRAWAVAIKLSAAHPDPGKVAGADEIGRLLVEVCGRADLDAATLAELDALGLAVESARRAHATEAAP